MQNVKQNYRKFRKIKMPRIVRRGDLNVFTTE